MQWAQTSSLSELMQWAQTSSLSELMQPPLVGPNLLS